MPQKLLRIYKSHRDKIHYLFFGGTTTLVNWGAYALLVSLAGCSITVGNVAAWSISVAYAFVTNKLWVFESRSWQPALVLREAVSFLGFRLVSGLVELAGVPLLISLGLDAPVLGVGGFAAKLLIGVLVIILNYVFSKLFVFRKK